MKDETIEIKIPEGWEDVTVEQYQKIISLKEHNILEVIAILLNVEIETIKKIDVKSLNSIISNISWVSKLDLDASYKNIIELDGRQFGFINKLTDLTLGEWIDLEYYIENQNENLHKIFSILYRPLVIAYSDTERLLEEYKQSDTIDNLFKQMKISDVYGAIVFFSLIEQESMITIKGFLQKEIVRMTQLN
jgi:hypothetical protein